MAGKNSELKYEIINHIGFHRGRRLATGAEPGELEWKRAKI